MTPQNTLNYIGLEKLNTASIKLYRFFRKVDVTDIDYIQRMFTGNICNVVKRQHFKQLKCC